MNNFLKNPAYDSIKSLLLLVIIVGAGYFIGSFAISRSDFLRALVNPENAVTANFAITTTESDSVEKNLYGSSTAQYFDLFNWNGDPDMQNIVTELDSPLLRFPSGGNSKWYHFRAPANMEEVLTPSEISHLVNGNEIRGYGKIEADAVAADVEIGGIGYQDEIFDFIGQPGTDHAKSDQGKQEMEPQNFIRDFADMANDLGADVLFVMNIKNNTPSEVAEQVQFLVDQGVNIVGIEVGNEQYSKSNYYLPGNPLVMAPQAVTNYLTHAAAYKSAVQAILPSVPFAVTAAPNKSFAETEGVAGGGFDADGDFNVQWNIALADAMGDYGYTNYILHYYSNFDNCTYIPTDEANVDEWFDCGLAELPKIFGTTDPTSFPNLVDYYVDTFGESRKMWFTEWNINQDPNKTDAIFGNTLFHAIYSTNMLNALVSINDKHDGLIKFSTYHTMGTEGVKNAMISPRKGGENLDEFPGSPDHPNRRASYFAFLTMKDIFWNEMDKVSTETTYDINPGQTYVNVFKDGNDYVIHIANPTDKTIKIGDISIDGQIVDKSTSTGSSYFVEADSIGASHGKSRFIDNPSDQIEINEDSGAIDELLFPAYSVGYVKIENLMFVPEDIIDTKNPSIVLTAPTSNMILTDNLLVKARATDDVGITKVQFFAEPFGLIGEDTTEPYTYQWSTTDIASGIYMIKAKAFDAAGNATISSSVKVKK